VRVVYERTMLEKLEDAKYEADVKCKRIEKIVLTKAEWEQVRGELRDKLPQYFPIYSTVFGVRIEVE
jgi:hypothetical protein